MDKKKSEFETRCKFNAYCKKALRNELIDSLRERKKRFSREVSIEDLTPQEKKQLYIVDEYFVDRHDDAYCICGLMVSRELLNEALSMLPDEKLQVIVLLLAV